MSRASFHLDDLLKEEVAHKLGGCPPDALVVFSSLKQDRCWCIFHRMIGKKRITHATWETKKESHVAVLHRGTPTSLSLIVSHTDSTWIWCSCQKSYFSASAGGF
jgi:hypothetical protein